MARLTMLVTALVVFMAPEVSGRGLRSQNGQELTTTPSLGVFVDALEAVNEQRANKRVSGSVDCEVSAWEEWSTCDESSMTQTRKRTVETAPQGSGSPCPRLVQTIPCKPVHCAVSAWGEWSACLDPGYKIRRRTVVREPKYGGTECPHVEARRKCHPKDCFMSDWSHWVCDEATATKRRTRHVTKPAQAGGEPCPKVEEETEPCDPIDCELDDAFGPPTCDSNGLQKRYRLIRTKPKFNGMECDTIPGYEQQEKDGKCPVDCKFTEWSKWSNCDPLTGKKKQTRTVKAPEQYDGKPCDGGREREESCPSPPRDSFCVVTPENECPVDKLLPSTQDGSTLIYPGGKTRCAFDDYTDPVTGFTSSAAYFFQVFPTRNSQPKKKLMLYLQGGGACSGDDMCAFAVQCSMGEGSMFIPSPLAFSKGLLNRSDENNLFNDWDIVHVPYCTGDIYVGKHETEAYVPFFALFLGQPQCLNRNMKAHHNGYENTLAVFKWALANYPEPEQLVLSGYSAGSLGAQLHSKTVADMWKVEEKKIKYDVIADSYAGVAPDIYPFSVLLQYFEACDFISGLSSDLVTKCKQAKATTVEVMSDLIQKTSSADWLFVNSKGDIWQRIFYQLSLDGILGFQFANLPTESDFFGRMTQIFDAYKSISSRVSAYFVEGEHHDFLDIYQWYNTPLMGTDKTLGEIISTFLLRSDAAPCDTPDCL
ncbi:hypothetical protein Poli38472_004502 [Pythium oligandrum]|uniref:Spondin-like TSP1 domain-containing protein n=1 Tax=Pythium oligandrum TaxID=41045 RepID=A0A8K1CAJ4_PYTOL|nr:hypothetical protein Poli38472_004502 [Pythium oligandrum]|eukprot:TMW59433.1 hypothetical protein Poli38472_004502 [Pythium oligandrum]